MALKTRRPTGAVPWPLILIEGGEKTGKCWSAGVLSASPKVGRTVIIDLSEGAWDEYGQIPGARFEIAVHDGTWTSILGAIEGAKEEAGKAAAAGEPPFVLVIDGMTAIWELLKDWASARARTSRGNRAKLEKDPNAEITIPMNLWNDANSRHKRLMSVLMTFPGIVVMVARGGPVAAVGENGQPVEGKKTYRVEANKTVGFDATCWVRVSRDDKPMVVGARSVHAGVRPGIDPPKTLPDDWTLEWLVFDALKCDPAKAHVRDLVVTRADELTPEQIRDEALAPRTVFERVKELHAEAERLGYDDVTVFNENQAEELLLKLLLRIGNEKRKAEMPRQPAAVTPAAARDEAPAAPAAPVREAQVVTADEDWLGTALASAGKFATEEEGRKLWLESVTKVRAGECTKADAARVQEVITARFGELRQKAAGLEPDDPWAPKVDGLADDEEAVDALAEVAELARTGDIDEARADQVSAAIVARFPHLAGEAQAAA